MTVAIICVRNFPPRLSYVSTLPDYTKIRNASLTSWRRGSLTLGTVFLSVVIINEAFDQWQRWLRACVKAKGHQFEHLLW